MWQQVRTAVLLFAAITILTGVAYPLVVTGVSQALFPRQANGSLVEANGIKIASAFVGQPFSNPRYFWGRPSVTTPVAYNGAHSTGSNLGPSNNDLKAAVQKRIDALLSFDPGNHLPIPVDLVTASGSGLDPHISPASALYQVSRVAKARGIDKVIVEALVLSHIKRRPFGIFGEPTVHVIHLNLALDAMR